MVIIIAMHDNCLFYPNIYTLIGEKHFNGKKEIFLMLNTFYLWIYSIGHMVKDHSDSD